MSWPLYADGRELAYTHKLSRHARMLYAFSHVLISVEFCELSSIAVLSDSWPPLGVSPIFYAILVFFAFWLTSISETYPLISLYSLRSAATTRLFFEIGQPVSSHSLTSDSS